MALKQDEKALLQLVCERGQSYDDIAELLGIPTDSVRDKARSALEQLGGADPDAEVGLTDYLLGQADPIGRADAVRYLQQDDEARALAGEIITKLELLAPKAKLPTLPEPRGRKRKPVKDDPVPAKGLAEPKAKARAKAEKTSPEGIPVAKRSGVNRPAPDTKLIAIFAAGGLALLIGILAIAGVFSGDDDGGSDQTTAGDILPAGDDPLLGGDSSVTQVNLKPSGGSGAGGEANFGVTDQDLFVDLRLSGLDTKSAENELYVVWLMLDKNIGIPLSPVTLDENGNAEQRIPVPADFLALVPQVNRVRVSLSKDRALTREILAAAEVGIPATRFTGDVISQGNVPLAEPEGETGAGAGAGAIPDAGAGSGASGDAGADTGAGADAPAAGDGG